MQAPDPYGHLAIIAGHLALAGRECLDLSEQASEVRISAKLSPDGLTFDVQLLDKGQTIAGFGQ